MQRDMPPDMDTAGTAALLVVIHGICLCSLCGALGVRSGLGVAARAAAHGGSISPQMLKTLAHIDQACVCCCHVTR